MYRKMKVKLLKINIFLILLITSILFFSCSFEKKYVITDNYEYNLISDLLAIHGQLSTNNDYILTKKQMSELSGNLILLLEISSCNLENYISESNQNFYLVKIEDSQIKIEESTDFRYVWDPDGFDAIKDGKYKGYVKKPYLDEVLEISNFTKLLSFYKSINLLRTCDEKGFLPDYYKYEYMFLYYLRKI